jgi:hypothetical protein
MNDILKSMSVAVITLCIILSQCRLQSLRCVSFCQALVQQ